MGRRIEFEPEEALERAMRLFWRMGYEATSIQDLVKAMGINRFSLYNTFGDKQKLFAAVLDHYNRKVIDRLLGPLEAESAGKSAIRDYFETLLIGAASKSLTRGCLLTNSAIERSVLDAAAKRRVDRHFERILEAFQNALSRAKNNREVSQDLNISGVSQHLAMTAIGLAVYAKSRPDAQQLDGYLDTLMTIVS